MQTAGAGELPRGLPVPGGVFAGAYCGFHNGRPAVMESAYLFIINRREILDDGMLCYRDASSTQPSLYAGLLRHVVSHGRSQARFHLAKRFAKRLKVLIAFRSISLSGDRRTGAWWLCGCADKRRSWFCKRAECGGGRCGKPRRPSPIRRCCRARPLLKSHHAQ